MIGTTHFTNAVVEARAAGSDRRRSGSGCPRRRRCRRWSTGRRRCATRSAATCASATAATSSTGAGSPPLDAGRAAARCRRLSPRRASARSRSRRSSRRSTPSPSRRRRPSSREELPGRRDLALARDRPDRPARARERDDHERLPPRAARRTSSSAFRAALAELGIEAPVYLSQNDGTLMAVDYAERYPVPTFASGPTNSMRGAAFLSGLDDCAVVDIGGTTSDVGILQHGFPREAAVAVEIGGVRTNFRMPDVLSLGLGGGSYVDGAEVGPRSVGYELTSTRAGLRRRRADRDRPCRGRRARRDRRRGARGRGSTRSRRSRGSRSGSPRPSIG